MSNAPPLPPQPLFTVAFEGAWCRFALRFNDLPVATFDASTSTIDTEVPLNPSLVAGPNTFTVTVLPGARDDGAPVPLSHPGSRLVAEVTVRTLGAPAGTRKRLGGISREAGVFTALEADVDAPVAGPAGAVAVVTDTDDAKVARQVLQLQSPFPAWLWTRAEPLRLDDATTADVIAEYRRLWAILSARDEAGLRALLLENAREVQTAFGLASLDDAWSMLTFEDLVRRPTISVLPMPTEGLRVELLAEGRVARLLAPDGRSAIRLHDSELGAEGAVSVLVCKLPARGWVHIR